MQCRLERRSKLWQLQPSLKGGNQSDNHQRSVLSESLCISEGETLVFIVETPGELSVRKDK